MMILFTENKRRYIQRMNNMQKDTRERKALKLRLKSSDNLQCCICLLNELTDSASLSSCRRLFHKVASLYPKVLFRNTVLDFASINLFRYFED